MLSENCALSLIHDDRLERCWTLYYYKNKKLHHIMKNLLKTLTLLLVAVFSATEAFGVSGFSRWVGKMSRV